MSLFLFNSWCEIEILHFYLNSLFLFNSYCEIDFIYIAFVSHEFIPFQ